MALDSVAVAVPNGKAVPGNCVITYGGSRRTRSDDATCGELRALECMNGFFKRDPRVSFVLDGPGARGNDSSIASYFQCRCQRTSHRH